MPQEIVSPLSTQASRTSSRRRPAKVLIPITPDGDNETLLALAHQLAQEEPVLLLGLVTIPEGETLSAGAEPARRLRDLLQTHTDRVTLRAKARVRVTYSPWDEVCAALTIDPSIDLLVLNWPQHFEAFHVTPAELLSRPPCDIAIVRGPLPQPIQRILIPMRGGPHAERALSLGLELARRDEAVVEVLQLLAPEPNPAAESIFEGMDLILAQMPAVQRTQARASDQTEAVLTKGQDADLIVLGTVARPTAETASFGRITDAVMNHAPAGVIAVKTKRIVMPNEGSRFGAQAISVLVDRWFAENTFHANEFKDLARLADLKAEQGVSISLALPALNEEKTIGEIIHLAQRVFQVETPLLDEIIVVDSNSSDNTRSIARDLGVPVYIHQEILESYGARNGKGEALWKSLYVTNGDIIIWMDTDVTNFHPRFIYGLIGPFLHRQDIQFVKGFYRRPFKEGVTAQSNQGGRVTELTARPLLNLFYPELSGIVQPLSGEYGGRRTALEQMTFTSGYGVETSLLIDALEKFRLGAIGQVDLVERIHRHQSLFNLSEMSFAIIQTVLSKLERRYGYSMLRDVNRSMKRVFQEPGRLYLQVKEVTERQRPPMIDIPEYRQKYSRLVAGGATR